MRIAIMADNCTGSYDAAIADSNSWQNDSTGTYPATIADSNRLPSHIPGSFPTVAEFMRCRTKHDLRPYGAIITNLNMSQVFKSATIIYESTFSDGNVRKLETTSRTNIHSIGLDTSSPIK